MELSVDDLAMHVRDVPGLFCALDMHHGGAQRLPKGAGRDQRGDGEYDPEQAQSAWTRLARHSVSPLWTAWAAAWCGKGSIAHVAFVRPHLLLE
jgi:hypothetical protein